MIFKNTVLLNLVVLFNFLCLISAFDCSSNSECDCVNSKYNIYKIKCKNGTAKILLGNPVKEIHYLDLKEPLSNTDFLIYPQLSRINISNIDIGHVPENLFHGMSKKL